jgi:hypothetical protein
VNAPYPRFEGTGVYTSGGPNLVFTIVLPRYRRINVYALKKVNLYFRPVAVMVFAVLRKFLSVRIWTLPRLQVTCQWQLARLHTYIRPLQVAYDDVGP